MASLPSFSASDVQHRVGQASFDRGRRYFRDRAIFDVRREGRTLKAACHGSLPDPYYLHVTFDEGGITEADCSCPVGDGGFCKHVAALLLTWLADPDVFVETEPVDQALQRRSKEDLIGLIRLMLTRHPELEDLVAMPSPGSRQAALEPGVIERQVRRVFSGDLYEWGSAYRIGRDLERIARQGNAYAQHGDWASTSTLCRALIDGIMEHYEMLHDENGDVAEVVNTCVTHLGRILERATDPALRSDVAQLLYEVLRWDVAMGGVDLGYEAKDFLQAHATAGERADVCARIEADLERLGPADDWSSGWRREALGGLLLALQPGEVDDETYLHVCRASGRTEDLVARLLQLGRPDEALKAARAASDYILLQLTPHFLDHSHGEAIDALVLNRLGDGTDRRLVEWLKERARDRGDAELAQRLAERLFMADPSVERYADVLALSRTLGREDAVRTALRDRLQSQKAYAVLIEVYLHDDEPDEALKLLYLSEKEWGFYGRRSQLRLTVADAVAEARPEEALQLYLDAATNLIEQRGRSNYAEAARLLHKVRVVYQRRGKHEDWRLFIQELRDTFKTLRALQDELNKAGL